MKILVQIENISKAVKIYCHTHHQDFPLTVIKRLHMSPVT